MCKIGKSYWIYDNSQALKCQEPYDFFVSGCLLFYEQDANAGTLKKDEG